MAKRDGTGPNGTGSMTGRRIGYCANPNKPINNESILLLREQITTLQQQVIQLQETINKN